MLWIVFNKTILINGLSIWNAGENSYEDIEEFLLSLSLIKLLCIEQDTVSLSS